jgi:hypothetical protein
VSIKSGLLKNIAKTLTFFFKVLGQWPLSQDFLKKKKKIYNQDFKIFKILGQWQVSQDFKIYKVLGFHGWQVSQDFKNL